MCIVRNDDVSFTRGKRVNKEIILRYTSSRKTSYHANFQAQCLHGLPVLTYIGMTALLEMMMSVLQEVKGLTKKLYFIILLVGRPVPMQNIRHNVYTVYLF